VTHIPRKRFGQHFLIDQNIIRKIVAQINLRRTDRLVEIGPGLGALTKALLPQVDHLTVVEIDRDLAATLQQADFAGQALTVHVADALQFDFSALGTSLRIVGNLPYNISTPLIFHLLTHINSIQDMHFMLQKELVDRITAVPGHKHYGRLSVMVQYWCQTQALFTVPPQAFKPAPKVYSAVLRLIPDGSKPRAAHITDLSEVVKTAFMFRRKTLSNALKSLLTAADFAAVGIDATQRPEQLTVEQFVALANRFSASRSTGQ